MINEQMNKWGFREGTEFEGLMPKTMKLVGNKNCTGINGNEPNVHLYDPTANGYGQMKVISPYDIMMND